MKFMVDILPGVLAVHKFTPNFLSYIYIYICITSSQGFLENQNEKSLAF